jgi:hypothetical protein
VSGLHDQPSAQQLVESVREWLERDVLTSTTGRLNFHARVAINVLGMVEREMELGPEQEAEHAERLRHLGFGSEDELALAIRRGDVASSEDVRDAVWASVRAKLSVANPRYLARPAD